MRRLFLTRVKVMNGAGGLWVRKFRALQPPLNAGGGLSADLEGSSLRTYLVAALLIGTEELSRRKALPEYRTSERPMHRILTTTLFPDVEVTCLEVTYVASTSPKC